jgi:hypothetical protein
MARVSIRITVLLLLYVLQLPHRHCVLLYTCIDSLAEGWVKTSSSRLNSRRRVALLHVWKEHTLPRCTTGLPHAFTF